MITLCVTAQKGGVAKSTTAEALVLGLRNKGYRVLGIDLDQSANFTKYFINEDFEKDAFDLISGKAKISDVIRNDIIPGGNGLIYLPMFFDANPGKLNELKNKLKPVEKNYDFCIIDTAPTTNKVALSALTVSDYVIVPTEPSNDCIDGCKSTLQTIRDVRKNINNKLTLLGVLLVKYKENYNAHKAVKTLLENQKIKLFKTTIRESQAINNAKLLNESFFLKKYNTAKAVIDYHSFINEVLKGVKVS